LNKLSPLEFVVMSVLLFGLIDRSFDGDYFFEELLTHPLRNIPLCAELRWGHSSAQFGFFTRYGVFFFAFLSTRCDLHALLANKGEGVFFRIGVAVVGVFY